MGLNIMSLIRVQEGCRPTECGPRRQRSEAGDSWHIIVKEGRVVAQVRGLLMHHVLGRGGNGRCR